MAINKVIYGNSTLLDLSGDTVTAAHLETGYTAHDANGEAVIGTLNPGGRDTSDATAVPSQILSGQTAYIATGKTTGTMTNRGAVSGAIATAAVAYTVPEGYHNGLGTVAIDSTEQAKIIPTNIKSGVTILGVQGNAPTISLT